jgi:hypothetical protein
MIEQSSTSFSFSATRDGEPFPGAVFRCAIDRGPYQPCASPVALQGLEEGPHSFAVFAEDPESAAVDPEPASRGFLYYDLEEEVCEGPAGPDGEAVEEEAEEGGAPVEEPPCAVGPDGRPLPPEDCLLRTADTRVIVPANQNRLILVIRYTAFSPTDVIVADRVAGGHGPLALGSTRAHLARNGVYRLSQRLGAAEMDRVRAAKRFTVTIEVPGAPGHCSRYATHRLTARQAAHGQVAWIQQVPGATRRKGSRTRRSGSAR